MLPIPVFGRPFGLFGKGGGRNNAYYVRPMLARILSTQPSNLIGYWPLGESSGTTANDSSGINTPGAYSGIVTNNQDGIGDYSRSTLFGGGFINLSANLANLNTAFVNTSGTLFAWCKVTNAAIWTDGAIHTVVEIGADVNNRVIIYKTTANGQLEFQHLAGGTSKALTLTTNAPLGWFSVAITWDKTADQVKAYFNGAQVGSTQTGLGVWVGSLAAAWTALANERSTVALDTWAGYEAHIATWKVALSGADILNLGVL